NGESRKVNLVIEGDFGKSRYSDSKGFNFGVHRNILFPADYCPEVKLTHWQPRVSATPPSPQLSDRLVAATITSERSKRRYHLTPEGRAAKLKSYGNTGGRERVTRQPQVKEWFKRGEE